jgi:hypothetical protein
MMTNKRLLGVGVIVATILLLGAVTALAWPRDVEARYGEDNGRAAALSGRGIRGRQATGVENVPSLGSLADACAAGVQAEVDNAVLYDLLLEMADNQDIVRVFTSLQRASETRHLPAFESCAP